MAGSADTLNNGLNSLVNKEHANHAKFGAGSYNRRAIFLSKFEELVH
jgi:hypothetical protein